MTSESDASPMDSAVQPLPATDDLFRVLVDSVRDYCIFAIAPDGRIATWNQGARSIKGYAPGEIIGQHYEVFFTPEDRADGRPQRMLDEAARSGTAHDEGWRQRKDGTRFWADATLTALRGDDGTLRGFAKVTRDETSKHRANVDLQRALERARQAEEQLRGHAAELERRVEERTALLTRQTDMLWRINAELEQFAYIASHDLKEPLRMITSYLDLLLRRYGDRFDERGRGYVDTVVAATVRMRELVESVLEYSRADAGIDSLEVTPAREALDAALSDLQGGIVENGAELVIGALPKVRANRVQLARLFQNLIANAVKFRASRPLRIVVSARVADGEWVFSVADNGIGIDPRFHDRLFRIFQRLHTPDEYAGSGIGLATCKKIVERHGGRIWVESALGAGSTFLFTLPRE
jgi:PAS domain S-box-containing protein